MLAKRKYNTQPNIITNSVSDMSVIEKRIVYLAINQINTGINFPVESFKNLDFESRESITDKKNEKKPTKPSFFKKLFMEENEKYMNTLYTQDEINAIYASEDVTKKKKDTDKATKAAAMIYLQHIKANVPEGRASAFESIYTQYYP